LLATQVMSRLRRELKLEVSLRILFDSSTLAALAANIEAIQFVLQAQAMEKVPGNLTQQNPTMSEELF
jgi:hypothetical protein